MRVNEIMTSGLISVGEDATLTEALHVLVDRKVSGLVVLDREGVAIGVLSEGDLMRRAELGAEKRRPAWLEFILGGGRVADEYRASHGRRVGEIMTRDPITIDASAEVAEAIDSIIAHKIKRLIVSEDGKAVGVVSRSDILKALLAAMPAASGPRTDAEILTDISAGFEREPWAPRGGVRASCENGVVTLEGAITDERIRPAMRVLVENVAGVKEVKDRVAWVEPNSGYLVENVDENK